PCPEIENVDILHVVGVLRHQTCVRGEDHVTTARADAGRRRINRTRLTVSLNNGHELSTDRLGRTVTPPDEQHCDRESTNGCKHNCHLWRSLAPDRSFNFSSYAPARFGRT